MGIITALAAVLFTCWPQHKQETAAHKYLPLALIIGLPALLFVGSGLIDTLVNHVQLTYLNDANYNAYLIGSFATAATIGSAVLLLLVLSGRQRFDVRSIVAGVAIGIPNYFSIWCLVRVLKLYPGNSSAIIPINNMAIVLLSSLVAWWLFGERLSAINRIGIVLSIAAIALIAFG